MRTQTTAVAVTAALLLATLTACGGGTEAAPSRSTITPSPDTASAPTAEAEPSATPTAQAPMKLGEALAWDDPENDIAGTAQVISYQQDVAKSAASADEEFDTKGYVWAALDIKVCSTKGAFTATPQPWTLAYADSSRIEPSSTTYDSFPRPEFPFETKLSAGKCVRGKIVYPVPGNQRPATVVYAPQSMTEPGEWTVPKT